MVIWRVECSQFQQVQLSVALGSQLGLDSWTCHVWNAVPSSVGMAESLKTIGTNSRAKSLTVPVFSGCSSVESMILSISVSNSSRKLGYMFVF